MKERCDMLGCNPMCLRCGDTPSCGDGSWGFMGGVHVHRCRDAHPQCGHDQILCEKHQPKELIAMLLDEVKALRIVRDVKNDEVDRLAKERDELREAVRVLKRGVLAGQIARACLRRCPSNTGGPGGQTLSETVSRVRFHNVPLSIFDELAEAEHAINANQIAREAVEGA